MKETMLAWKAALVVFFTALGELLGWKGSEDRLCWRHRCRQDHHYQPD